MPRDHAAWSREREDELMELIAEGLSFAEAAAKLNPPATKQAAFKKFKQLCERMGQQAQ